MARSALWTVSPLPSQASPGCPGLAFYRLQLTLRCSSHLGPLSVTAEVAGLPQKSRWAAPHGYRVPRGGDPARSRAITAWAGCGSGEAWSTNPPLACLPAGAPSPRPRRVRRSAEARSDRSGSRLLPSSISPLESS